MQAHDHGEGSGSMTTHRSTHAADTCTKPVGQQLASDAARIVTDLRQERHLPRAHRRDRRCSSRSLTDGILLRPQNITNLIVQNGYILILAIGMVIVIIAGHIDLSVGSVAAFIGAVAGVVAVQDGAARGGSPCIVAARGRRAGRRLAGLLGRLRRHPRVHRDAGGHAHLPRSHARRARQLADHRLVPGGVPQPRQRLLRRASSAEPGSTCSPSSSARSPIVGLVVSAGAHPRRPPQLRPGRRAARRGSSLKIVLVRRGRHVRSPAQLATFKGIPIVADHPRRARASSTASSPTAAVFGRHIYAIGGNLTRPSCRASRSSGSTSGIFVNMGSSPLSPASSSPRASTWPAPRPATASSSTRSPPPSSVAPPCRVASAPSIGRHHRWPHHGRAEQRHVDPGHRHRLAAGRQGPRAPAAPSPSTSSTSAAPAAADRQVAGGLQARSVLEPTPPRTTRPPSGTRSLGHSARSPGRDVSANTCRRRRSGASPSAVAACVARQGTEGIRQ